MRRAGLARAALRGAIVGIAALLAAATPGPRAAQPYTILVPGSYHGAEVPAATEGSWGAVCGTREGTRLERARVSLETVFDDIVDPSPARKSGRRVDVAGCSDLQFLVRGLPAEPRPLKAAPPAQDTGQGRGTAFGGRMLTVRRMDGSEGWSLRLAWGDQEQPLFVSVKPGRGSWDLPWVGDLDGDGRPDLLLQAADEDNVRVLRLFLSSAAREGELVREVAAFRTTSR